MEKEYDAIIIGAGVIGLTQAVALVQAGFTVAIVDQNNPPVNSISDIFDARVFALNRYSENCLQQWDIWPHIKKLRYAAYHEVKLAIGNTEPNLSLMDKDDAEPNLGHIVEQQVWRLAAFEALETSDHCDFYWQHELKQTEKLNSTRIKILLQESPVTHSQSIITLRTQLLIGADGAHSKVRENAHIASDNFPTNQIALVFNLKLTESHQFKAQQFFSSLGIIAFLPLPEAHHYSIVWSIPQKADYLLELSNEALCCEIKNICGIQWGEIEIVSKRYTFPLQQQQAKTYIGDHTVLIGDAAHVIHPLAGQGANLGIADIAELTKQMTLARDKNRPLGDPVILRAYERQRRSAAWQMMATMSSLQKMGSAPIIIQQGLNLGATLLNKAKPIKNLLSRFALYRFTK